MKIGKVLERIGDKGLTKDHIYYWEKIGLIKPKNIKKAKIDRKDYSEKDFEKIELIWKYYKEGFPPKLAQKKAVEELEYLNKIEKISKEELANKLLELKDSLKTNPELELSAQGILELKDVNFLNSLIETVGILRQEKEAARKSGDKKEGDKLEIFLEKLEKPKSFSLSGESIEKLCNDLGVLIREMDYPDNIQGMSGRILPGSYHIFVNKKLGRQKSYVLSHELLHIISGDMHKFRNFLLELVDRNIVFLNKGNKK